MPQKSKNTQRCKNMQHKITAMSRHERHLFLVGFFTDSAKQICKC